MSATRSRPMDKEIRGGVRERVYALYGFKFKTIHHHCPVRNNTTNFVRSLSLSLSFIQFTLKALVMNMPLTFQSMSSIV